MEIKLVIDERLVAVVKRVFRHILNRRIMAGMTLSLVGGMAFYVYAASKPYTFVDGATISAAQVNANFDSLVSELNVDADVHNIRAILSKATANSYCPSGSVAIHTPYSYRGKTGNQICAADGRAKYTCAAVKYIYITNSNGYGSYPTNDPSCGSSIRTPWPWGDEYDAPNTLDGEWGHGDTYVVCCK